MKEEEIINNIKTMLENNENIFEETGTYIYFSKPVEEDVKCLLDLYEKEKKKYNDMINCCNELMKQITELQSDIQQKDFEIGCLNSDIKNMYCEEGVISILEDEFDLNREEAIEILENY